MTTKTKILSLTWNVIRRLANCSRDLSSEQKAYHLTELMTNMRTSGYLKSQTLKVLTAGTRGFFRKVEREKLGGSRVNRPRQDGERKRQVRKFVGPATWFRPRRCPKDKTKPSPNKPLRSPKHQLNNRKPSQQDKSQPTNNQNEGPQVNITATTSTRQPRRWNKVVEAPLYVPATPHAELRKAIQQVVDAMAKLHNIPTYKVVERKGPTIKGKLSRSNPWAGEPCGRNCFPCATTTSDKERGKCLREGVNL